MVVEARDEPAECRRCLVVEQRRTRRGEDAALAPAVAKRNALAGLGNAVTVRAGQAFDQTAQAKTAQVIAGTAGTIGVGAHVEQRRDLLAPLAVCEAHGQQPEGEQGGEQRLDARFTEAKRRHAPFVHHDRAMQLLEGLHPERAVVAEPRRLGPRQTATLRTSASRATRMR